MTAPNTKHKVLAVVSVTWPGIVSVEPSKEITASELPAVNLSWDAARVPSTVVEKMADCNEWEPRVSAAPKGAEARQEFYLHATGG
jgi:hypothetical protein